VDTNRTSLVTDLHDPLFAIVFEENGRNVVRYFASEAEADAFVTDEHRREAFEAIGSFKDLDWEEMLSELERIRHESAPTPPIIDP
jgi:hypothetical protein